MALTKVSGSILKDPLNLGEVSIGGTLTYQDVTNVDSLGIGTFRAGINVSGGQVDIGSNIKLGNAGIITATELDISGDIDVDGHTELDNVNISGIVTVSSDGINSGILDLKTGNNLRLRFSSGGTAQFRGDTDPIASFDRGSANSTNVKWGYLGADRGIISSISNEFRITASGTIPMTFHSNGSERLRIDSNGFLGIDNASPVSSHASARNLVIGTASGTHGMTIMSGTSSSGHIEFSDGTSSDAEKTAGGIRYYHGGASENYMRFNTNGGTERLRIDSNGYLSFAGDTDTYIHHPEDNEIAITVSGGSFPIVRFGTGGSNSTVGFSTDTTLVTNSERMAVRGVSSFKSTSNVYAPIYTHNEGNTSGTYNAHLLWNAGGANRGGIGYMPNNGEVIFNNQNPINFATGATHLGGTTRLRIDNNGYVTKPAHPSFCARHQGSDGFSGDIIVLTKISTAWDVWNTGGHYSTSTGKFTVPVTGVYYFEGQLMTTGHSNGDNIQDMLQLYSNNGRISYCRQRKSYFRSDEDDNGYYTNSVGGPARLSAGDTVWLQRQSGHSWSYSNRYYSYFTGWLIG